MAGLSFSEHRGMGIVRRGGKETWGQDVRKKGRKEGGMGGRRGKCCFFDSIDTVSSFVSIIFATIKNFSREKQLLFYPLPPEGLVHTYCTPQLLPTGENSALLNTPHNYKQITHLQCVSETMVV